MSTGPLKVEAFTRGKVFSIVEDLKDEGIPTRSFSDVVDGAGYQYVDLVQEGGGVLGVALLGYAYVLEQMGIRFFSLAGTSAGAINTMMLAAHGRIDEEKVPRLIDRLANKNLYDFVDGSPRAKKIIAKGMQLFEQHSNYQMAGLAWQVFQMRGYLLAHLGFNPGDNFLNWVTDSLTDNGIHNLGDLKAMRAELPPGLAIRPGRDDGRTLEGLSPRLVLVAADITTSTRVLFPEMAALYWEDPDSANPAYFVRASMSVPGFFFPLRLTIGDAPSEALRTAWHNLARFDSLPPKEALLVDGGLVSNFPIDVFHNPRAVPRLPTFGVKLSPYRHAAKTITSPLNYLEAMFDSTQRVLDFQFFLTHPDYRRLVARIDTGGQNWLDFAISNEAKLDLFERGAQTAATFLRGFNWAEYKALRGELMKGQPATG